MKPPYTIIQYSTNYGIVNILGDQEARDSVGRAIDRVLRDYSILKVPTRDPLYMLNQIATDLDALGIEVESLTIRTKRPCSVCGK